MAGRVNWTVTTLSGQPLIVQSQQEKKFYEEAQAKYLSENKFTDASDIRALERLITFEMLIFRAQSQLAVGLNEHGHPLDEKESAALHKNLKEMANTVSMIQKDLGLLKVQRDKDKFDTVGAYIQELLNHAEEFGVTRESMLDKALELTKELFGKVGAYKRSNEHERRKINIENADVIVDWIYDYMEPEFNKVDEHFQKNQQKYWVREL